MSPQGRSPVVFQHTDAVAKVGGREARASVVPYLAVLLVARGADRIVIPAPDSQELERVEEGIAATPRERQHLIHVADKGGRILRSVLDYMKPLGVQAQKWPEDAFVSFATRFLYEVALGVTYGATVLSNSTSVVRDFVPIINPTYFQGEARFRLAEVCRMICSYQPAVVEHGLYSSDESLATTETALRIMQSAEFHTLAASTEHIGYLKNPLLALRELRHRFLELMRKPQVEGLISLAATAADAAGGSGIGELSARAFALTPKSSSRGFNPPFVSLGPTELSLYRTILREGLPESRPPDGVIMAFKGRSGVQWMNEGEENKLQLEAEEVVGRSLAKWKEAVSALDRFVGG